MTARYLKPSAEVALAQSVWSKSAWAARAREALKLSVGLGEESKHPGWRVCSSCTSCIGRTEWPARCGR